MLLNARFLALELPLACALLGACCSSAEAHSRPAQEPFDLQLKLAVGEPLLVEVRQNFKLDLAGTQFKISRDMSFVDEYALLEGDNEICDRRFLKVQDEVNGDASDPAYVGVDLRYTRAFGESQITLNAQTQLPQKTMQELLALDRTLGCNVQFPGKWALGEEQELDLLPVAGLLVGWESPIASAGGKFVFESFDPQTTLATFTGQLTIEQNIPLGEAAATLSWIGDCTLVNNVKDHCLAGIQYSGRTRFVFDEGSKSSKGTFRVDMTGAKGELAKAASASDAFIRTRPYHFPSMQVSLDLPSSWAMEEGDAELQPYLFWTRAGKADPVTIQVLDVQVQQTSLKDITNYLKDTYKGDETYRGLTSVKSKFGPGVSVEFEQEREDGTLFTLVSDFYLRGDRWLLVKFEASPKAFKAHSKDFARARKSLKSATR